MKHYRINLNREGSLERTIEYLKTYKRDLIEKKCDKFCNKLIEKGIKVAQVNCGEYGNAISFTAENKSYGNVVAYAFVGKKMHDIESSWRYQGGIKTVKIDPLLMAEFGSGWYANVVWNVTDVGQGTFPDQKHAFDSHGWFWTDEKGVKHHSRGTSPTYPMYKAWIEMQASINETIKEVFK